MRFLKNVRSFLILLTSARAEDQDESPGLFFIAIKVQFNKHFGRAVNILTCFDSYKFKHYNKL
jgi:hypothetical protein